MGAAAASNRPTALVVEDDYAVSVLLQRCLTRAGCDVTTASTLADGRTFMEKARFEIVLCDYNLPDGEGPALVQWALDSRRASVAYGISSDTRCARVVSFMLAGATDVIEKPCSF